jgi:hypothetical protein
MITVGIVLELYFIAFTLKQPFRLELTPESEWQTDVRSPLTLRVTPNGILDVWYRNTHIWNEKVQGDDSFFGIESCDSISRILACIDAKDHSWKEKYYFNESKGEKFSPFLVDTNASA